MEANGSRAVRRTAIAVDQTVVTATPVDEGTARSNWRVGINFAPSGTRKAFTPGSKGSTAASNTAAAISEGVAKISRFKKGEIHITNNLDYIGDLNDGKSAQAPANFVQTAAAAGQAVARKQKVLK